MTKLCECGCGQPAPIATITKRKWGHVKGEPMRFVNGHNPKRGASYWHLADQLCECGCGRTTNRAKNGRPRQFIRGHSSRSTKPLYIADPETGCWLWQRAISDTGYGLLQTPDGPIGAHRYFYEQAKGPIPPGLHIDHVRKRGCVHRACVNPDHMEPVLCVVNVRRGATPKLSFEIAEQIRARHAAGETHFAQLAAEYHVDHKTIRSIVSGRTWRPIDTTEAA